MASRTRSLALAGSSGLVVSLLSALPASAHGLAGAGLAGGALHPLSGLDHLLLLVGVGALAARVDGRLLLPAIWGAIAGAVFGVAGLTLPGGEVLAALSVSALGLLLLLALRPQSSGPAARVSAAVVAAAVAIHALLHGHEAQPDPSWWIGAALAAIAVVGVSALLLRHSGTRFCRALAVGLGLAGLALAVLPIA